MAGKLASFDAEQRSRFWPRWPVLALALHGALLALLWSAETPSGKPAPAARLAALEVELEAPSALEGATPAEAAAGDTAGSAPARLAMRAPSARSGAMRAPSPAEPSGDEPEAPVEPAPDEGPQLSLDDLGVGRRNPFIGSELARKPAPAKRRQKARGSRFSDDMASAILHADHSRSLGPTGPALSELETATRRSEAPANGKALLRFSTDKAGRVRAVEVVEASSDLTPWRRVAQRVLAALRDKKLPIPKTRNGVTFTVRIESRQALPSGADPGVAINVLGIPLQEGDGERSTRIEILNLLPKVELEKVPLPSGQGLEVPSLTLGSLFALFGDPVDIGAPAQRVVHAQVEELSVNEDASGSETPD